MDNTFLSSGFSTISQQESDSSYGLYIKHAFDMLFAIIAIVVFAIPCLVIAWLIWREDRHDPLFRQERIGQNGRPFTLYKFRSMRVDAENDHPELCADHDSRLTRIGAFLRAHHLDELPQLINVIRGEMSFVGHRPERRYFIEQIMERNSDYQRLYALRPGLFSHATLYNGYTDTMEKMLIRLEMDLDYLDNRSLLLDCKIITKTAISILIGKRF